MWFPLPGAGNHQSPTRLSSEHSDVRTVHPWIWVQCFPRRIQNAPCLWLFASMQDINLSVCPGSLGTPRDDSRAHSPSKGIEGVYRRHLVYPPLSLKQAIAPPPITRHTPPQVPLCGLSASLICAAETVCDPRCYVPSKVTMCMLTDSCCTPAGDFCESNGQASASQPKAGRGKRGHSFSCGAMSFFLPAGSGAGAGL